MSFDTMSSQLADCFQWSRWEPTSRTKPLWSLHYDTKLFLFYQHNQEQQELSDPEIFQMLMIDNLRQKLFFPRNFAITVKIQLFSWNLNKHQIVCPWMFRLLSFSSWKINLHRITKYITTWQFPISTEGWTSFVSCSLSLHHHHV